MPLFLLLNTWFLFIHNDYKGNHNNYHGIHFALMFYDLFQGAIFGLHQFLIYLMCGTKVK